MDNVIIKEVEVHKHLGLTIKVKMEIGMNMLKIS
jgi:hypothetical protein